MRDWIKKILGYREKLDVSAQQKPKLMSVNYDKAQSLGEILGDVVNQKQISVINELDEMLIPLHFNTVMALIMYGHEPIKKGQPKTGGRMKRKKATDALLLYVFYAFSAKAQSKKFNKKVSAPWATNGFCQQGLGWGKQRFYNAKKILEELNLIKTIQAKDNKGRWGKTFIRVRFMPQKYLR